MTPLSDISPKTVTQQEFLLFHIIPAAVQGLQQYNKKKCPYLYHQAAYFTTVSLQFLVDGCGVSQGSA